MPNLAVSELSPGLCGARHGLAPGEAASLTTDEIDQPTPADRMVHALMGRCTGFMSPGSMALAWVDWWVHLSASPGKQQLLLEKIGRAHV